MTLLCFKDFVVILVSGSFDPLVAVYFANFHTSDLDCIIQGYSSYPREPSMLVAISQIPHSVARTDYPGYFGSPLLAFQNSFFVVPSIYCFNS